MSNDIDNRNTGPAPEPKRSRFEFGAAAIFGLIMIIVYVGMGVALLANAFPWISGEWAWLRWTAGVLLIIYGIFRAWRYIKGIN